ncbi:MAG TPA: hypothetical protein VNN80_18550 [Polyangiaceae bacterium]|nr:hypothetical protein [Polyangiaceae bacterium]
MPRGSTARCWAAALAGALLTLGWGARAGAEVPPDFVASLRAGLAVRGWLDAARERGFVQVGTFTSKIYRAWKVDVADLDGDGTREVLLGIWSTTRRHEEPEPHRTVWVLRWDAARHQLSEAWRGSALARPLRDFGVEGERLVARERWQSRCYRTTYAWNGFGFVGQSVAREGCSP